MHTKLSLPSLLTVVLRYEWRAHWRAGQSCWLPAAFLLMIACLWPLALPAELPLLKQIGPGMIWVAVLLAVILVLDKLFSADFADYAIVHWLLSPYSLMILVLVRIAVVSVVFLSVNLLLMPLYALLYQLPADVIWHLSLTLVLGIPCLIAVGAIISALLVGVGSRTVLLPLLLVPLWSPVLIFSTSSVYQHTLGLPTGGHFAMMAALLLLTLSLAPFAVSAALRMSME